MPYLPCAVVWTPIPGLTSALRNVGHMGITDSEGNLYDFGADYTIGCNEMMFGEPTRAYSFLPHLPLNNKTPWDLGVNQAIDEFKKQRYSFVRNNCHSFVKCCLRKIDVAYKDSDDAEDAHITLYGITGLVFKLRPKMVEINPTKQGKKKKEKQERQIDKESDREKPAKTKSMKK